ncbi:MAG: hypothetical protein ONB44_19275 [candidate division KSB1 bacterium]|nr:hypothetical protein [candidate division KSB1 bacterium]MDZ7304272.1 hypothetical protein [candidate division KSB1 bacterium]MDZ7312929.1 hypothetical protein [candidate division KSB1 bacterium]
MQRFFVFDLELAQPQVSATNDDNISTRQSHTMATCYSMPIEELRPSSAMRPENVSTFQWMAADSGLSFGFRVQLR